MAMHNLGLIIRLCARELRTGVRGFGVFLGCLCLGVLAISAVGSLGQALEQGLAQDAQAILGGDLSVSVTSRDLSIEEKDFLSTLGTWSAMLQTRSMARLVQNKTDADQAVVIELKAVDQAYPLYGQVKLQDNLELDHALATIAGRPGAVAAPELLTRLGCGVGDEIRIGNTIFRLQAVLEREPDQSMEFFGLGPRVMVSIDAFHSTGLSQPGSLFRSKYLLRLNHGDVQSTAQSITNRFPESGWRIRDYTQAAPGIRSMLQRMQINLTLVGLGALLVGGLGIAGGVRGYLNQRLKHIAIMKCLGGPSTLLFSTYLLQILVLACIGTGAGLVGGVLVPLLTKNFFAQTLSIEIQAGLYAQPLLQATLFGLATTLVFALPPLFRAIMVSPTGIFRGYLQAQNQSLPPMARMLIIMILMLIIAMIFWFSKTPTLSLAFVCAVAGAWLIFGALTRAIAWLASYASYLPRPSLRIGMANIRRPGSPGMTLVFALGFGLTALVTIVMVHSNLSRSLNHELAQEAPALFLMDITPAQVQDLKATLTQVADISRLDLQPMIRGRIVSIKDTPVEKAVIAEDVQWAVRGDRGFSYAQDFPAGSTLVRGTWWDQNYSGPPLISITADLAQGFDVDLGDSLTINVLGRNLKATIASIREVHWQSLAMQFAIILSPGVLDAAPQTWLGAIYGAQLEDRLLPMVSNQFPNITIIPVREVLHSVAQIMGHALLSFQLTAAVALVVGILVLAGSFAADQQQRIYDSVLYKVCGATRKDILYTLLAEFSLAGLVTSVSSLILGTLAAWGVVHKLLKMNFTPDFFLALITIAAGMLTSVIIGFLGTWRTLGQKATPFLRNP